MNTETIKIIEKMISNCKSKDITKWNYLKELLINNTVKIERNENEFDIISPSPGEDKKRQITWFEYGEPMGHATLDMENEYETEQMVLEYFYDIEDWKITEIIEG